MILCAAVKRIRASVAIWRLSRVLKILLPRSVLGVLRSVVGTVVINRPLYPRPFYGDKTSLDAVIAYNEFGGYCIPHSCCHQPAAQAVLRGPCWEKETLRFIKQHWAGGDLVHAGAAFGDLLPALSRIAPDGAVIWAFEPNPELYECAKITMTLSRLRNVRLQNLALSSCGGRGRLLVLDNNGKAMGEWSRILQYRDDSSNMKTIEVGVARLDDILSGDRRIAIVHLDLEGMEEAALLGALNVLKRDRSLLILETEPSREFFSTHFEGLGYVRCGFCSGNVIFAAE